VAIIGEAALSAEDRRVLDFTKRFEETFVGQGTVNREIEKTLDQAWGLLSPMPAELLKRIPKKFIEQYHKRELLQPPSSAAKPALSVFEGTPE
jgi:V/A-type H+-transporting ATPase subunit B